jgi:hypothetical protein
MFSFSFDIGGISIAFAIGSAGPAFSGAGAGGGGGAGGSGTMACDAVPGGGVACDTPPPDLELDIGFLAIPMGIPALAGAPAGAIHPGAAAAVRIGSVAARVLPALGPAGAAAAIATVGITIIVIDWQTHGPIRETFEALGETLIQIWQQSGEEGEKASEGGQEGTFWDKLKPSHGKTKTNEEKGKKKRFYEKDRTHGDLEVYDRRGRHLGSADPNTGEMTKPPVPGRRIDVP